MEINRDQIIRAVASSTAIETDKSTEYWERKLKSDWRPISTAPKDGTLILVFTETIYPGEDIFISSFRNGHWKIHIDAQKIEPIYWMPLPPPPLSK